MNRPNPELCPASVRAAFLAYINQGVPPGDFVRACLENNLCEAFARADDDNRAAMAHIVAWLYWEMPSNLWKSHEAVQAHLIAMREAIDDDTEPERDEPVLYERGELAPRDNRGEHDRTL